MGDNIGKNQGMTPKKAGDIRLGELLVEHRAISREQLNASIQIQVESGKKLGQILVERGYISEDLLLEHMARQLNIEYIDIKRYEIKPDVATLIPEAQARHFRVIALAEDAAGVLLGMADPADIFAHDEVGNLLRRPLKPALVKEADLLKTFDTVYRHNRTAQIGALAAELEQQLSATEGPLSAHTAANVSDAPVVKLLQSIFEEAIQNNASDIHIEPGQNELTIRFRIDGMLRVQATADKRIATALLSRLKLMAHLDIAERRLPQDGRFNIHIGDNAIDARISTMPLETGEAVALRLLNQSAGILDLDKLRMPEPMLKRLRQVMRSPHGIVLVTGPTGSGKTTTLYAMLKELNDPAVKIITVEDPVEYRLAGVNQVQVNPKVDLSFARVLRSILRHDPDIVLVGEMRDAETMQIGLRAAMSGHLVFSTLHTNDAISTVLRMVDMGAEPYLIAGAVRGILAQRLVRRICADCAAPLELDAGLSTFLKEGLATLPPGTVFKKGAGCAQCNHTGYLGRIAVFEYLAMSPELAERLHLGELMPFAKQAAQQAGYRPLKHSALQLAAEGLTTVDEVLRVSYGTEG